MKYKKKLTLSVNSGIVDAVSAVPDFNISKFVESQLMKELKKRGISIKCPFCGK